MNVSEFIFEHFNKQGIDTAFMITGGQAMFLNDALGKHGGYSIVCPHHEQTTTMAADAYGRIKNKPAIALVTAGPGAVNAMNGVVGGFTDSSPMIVISGHTNLPFVQYQNSHEIRQYGVQGINIGPLVKKVVKYFVTIEDANTLQYELEKAYRIATTGRPGPVWIEVPLDIQKTVVDEAKQTHYVQKNEMDIGVIKQAVKHTYEKLQEAKRPLLLVGQGVSLADARTEFRRMAEQLRIPVLTARLGIDLMESDSDLYVGRPGNYGERSANFAIQNADLIISIGCRLASSLVGHNPKEFGKHAYKIVVDIDPEELNKPNTEIQYKVLGDCKEFVTWMENYQDRYTVPCYETWVDQCQHWKKNFPVVQPEYKEETPVNSYYFVDRLSALANEHAVITVDTGSCFHVACQTWKLKKGQKYLTTGGISSMGYWVAGIGSCMANDKKETIIITGDGSLQMNLQEFAVIRHLKLPIKVFILNNNGYLLIRHTQHNFMDDRFVGESPETGVWCPDALKIAQAYGIKGVRIETADDVDAKIKEVLAYDGPVICDVMTPEWQLLVPRVASDKLPDGTLVSRAYSDMFPYISREEYHENMIAEKE